MKMGDGSDPYSAYDANGNIKGMKQWGLKMGSSPVIDEMTYDYKNSEISNKLLAVTESSTINTTDNKLGDFTDKNRTIDDYDYDVNGNLQYDKNKSIDNITYNHLNLPSVITVTGKGTIAYTYDAAGNKLSKLTTENNAIVAYNGTNYTTTIYTTTSYIAGFIYETKTYGNTSLAALQYTDKLQFAGQEEGRIRPSAITGTFAFDYFIKDHLGNIRMVLTDEVKQDIYPAATLEGDVNNNSTAAGYEKLFYTIDATKIVDNSEATGITSYQNNNGIASPYPAGNSGNINVNANTLKLYKLNSNTAKTGLGITLKVMVGDVIDIFGKSYYFQNNTGGSGTNSSIPYLELLNGFIGSPNGTVGAAGHGEVTGTQLNGLPATTAGIQSLFDNETSQNNSNPQTPKAYINYLFFDEQFKCVGSGFSSVGSNSVVKDHHSELQNIVVPKNGYVYIYCSNQSPVNVFFDNLQVVHTRGPILEETHYYPFGLQMQGISSTALNFGRPGNKIKFQGQEFASKEFSDGSGLAMYEFRYRMEDPQIGRFWQVDPLAHDYRNNSPYAFSENRVTDGRELEGLEYVSIHHYADGTIGTKMFYKSTDKEINARGGTKSGIYNSASYGPLGKGVVHYYYNSHGEMIPNETKWDQRQTGGRSDFAYHGLYSGPGSITTNGGENSTKYDFTFQPIDWADAIAKRHDMDYADATTKGEKCAGVGYIDDIRTLQADKDMVQRIDDYKDLSKKVEGVETPYRTSWSGEMEFAMKGQSVVISALATYKQWKIDHNYGNKDTYDKLSDKFGKDNALVAAIIDLINPNKK
jgi:RHS repeat-associated protein